jgi:hypothetical protein
MIKKILFFGTMIFPIIICALVLEGFDWIRKWIHAYKDWVMKD